MSLGLGSTRGDAARTRMMNAQKTVLQRCHGVAHRSERGVMWNQKMPCKHRIAPVSMRFARAYAGDRRGEDDTHGYPVCEPAACGSGMVVCERDVRKGSARARTHLAKSAEITPRRSLKNGMLQDAHVSNLSE